ncbi:MAG: hypothetical protein K9M07_05695 [Simkaniaceae bacterium]|nr:hypothetical protein [Simkaniaceae bacterium]
MSEKYTEKDDPDWLIVSAKWVEVTAQLNELKALQQQLKDHLITLSGNESSCGGGVRLLRSERKGAVRYRDIPELEGVDLDSYRNPSMITWTLKSG